MSSDNRNVYVEDAEKILRIATRLDLDEETNRDQFFSLIVHGNKKIFGSWVGDSFYEALRKKTKIYRHRLWLRLCLFSGIGIGLCLIIVYLLLMVTAHYENQKNEAVTEVLREMTSFVQDEDGFGILQQEDRNLLSGYESELERGETREANHHSEGDVSGTGGMEWQEDILAEYQPMCYLNPDMVGWVYIPDTHINYPVLQNIDDEDFYWNHDIQKNVTRSGSIFIDRETRVYPRDVQIVLYGHNMRDGTMFGDLKKYREQEFCRAHPIIYFDTLYAKGQYEIVAVVGTHIRKNDEPGIRYYWLRNYGDEEEFQEYKTFLNDESLYDTGVDFDYTDQLIVLSTCEYTVRNGRLIVVAKQI